jgi:hypothetical protein
VIRSFDSVSVEGGWRNGGSEVGPKPYMGMMVAEPTLVRSGSSATERNYLTGRILTADNRGNIFSVDMEDDDGVPLTSNKWQIRTIASLSRSSAQTPDSHSIPHGLAVGGSRGYSWAAGGTADIQVLKSAADPDEKGFLKNTDQMMFAFKLLKERDQSGLFGRNDFKELDTAKAGEVYNPSDTDMDGDGKYSGWYSLLRKDTANTFAEYVSTKSIIINGTLYVATFIRKDKAGAADSSVCDKVRAIDGDSRLFAVDVATGAGNTWDPQNGERPKYIEFKGVKIVSLTDMKEGGDGQLLISLDILNETDNNLGAIKESKLRSVLDDSGNSIPDMKTLEEQKGGGDTNLPPNANITQYWVKY